jgi:hypothetical protein
MRIVIEVDGEKVTALGSGDIGSAAVAPPGPAPAALLARAKKLGALSAGASTFGRGAALVATAQAGETIKPARRTKARKTAKKTAKKSKKKRASR